MPSRRARRITIVAAALCALNVGVIAPAVLVHRDHAGGGSDGETAVAPGPAPRTARDVLDDASSLVANRVRSSQAATPATTHAQTARAALTVPAKTAKIPCVDPVRDVRGQGPTCHTADGSVKVELANGRGAVLTHGGDPIPAGEPGSITPDDAFGSSTVRALLERQSGGRGISADTSLSTYDPGNGAPAISGTISDIVCAAEGDNAYRIAYVYPTDRPNRYTPALADRMRQLVYTASAFMDFEARSVDPSRHMRIKVRCDANGIPIVDVVPVHTTFADTGFGTVINDLLDHDIDRYWTDIDNVLVFVDGAGTAGAAGEGVTSKDESDSFDNEATTGRFFAEAYVSFGDWSWTTVLHEMSHNMGAVQYEAPNGTANAHCTDGQDIMCYPDGDVKPYRSNVCTDRTHYDCGHDDYFNPSPTPGTYIASHRNLATRQNAQVEISGTTDTAPPTAAFTGAAAAGASALTNKVAVATTDDVSVRRVDLEVAGGQVFHDYREPYIFDKKFALPQGVHTVTATAIDTSGNPSTPVTTTVDIDTVAPPQIRGVHAGADFDTVTYNDYFLPSRTTVLANWGAVSDLNGVEYSYCIERNARDCYDGTGRQTKWTTATGVTVDGAIARLTSPGHDLIEDNGVTSYQVCIETTDRAGNNFSDTNPMPCTYPLWVDDRAPSVPTVTGAGASVRDVTQVDLTWGASVDAGRAGLAQPAYQYCFSTTPGCDTGVVATGSYLVPTTKTLGTGLVDGQVYYGCVRAMDRASNRSAYACTSGQKLDLDAPTAPTAVIDGLGPADTAWLTTQGTISASWDATSMDTSSGVKEYRWCVTQPNGSCYFGTLGLDDDTGIVAGESSTTGTRAATLTQGQFYRVCVQAVDRVGRRSPLVCSNGATADTQAQAGPFGVRDGSTGDAAWQRQGSSVTSNWDATSDTPASGIADYSFCVTTAESCASGVLMNWTPVGPTTLTGTAPGLTLTSGMTARTCVRVTNGAGTVGAARCSNGISVDLDAPIAPTSSTPTGDEITGLRAQLAWTPGSDVTSGVERQTVSIDGAAATSLAPDAASWTTGTLTEGTHTWSVAAVDRAGNTTASATRSFVVDEAAPTTPGALTPADAAYIV
ncbi:MAG: hypothetical protein JWM98_3436, partial [Thermoleophilia bacterium]|nr:hypothetical protein [Thermoleophilia bacterium]